MFKDWTFLTTLNNNADDLTQFANDHNLIRSSSATKSRHNIKRSFICRFFRSHQCRYRICAVTSIPNSSDSSAISIYVRGEHSHDESAKTLKNAIPDDVRDAILEDPSSIFVGIKTRLTPTEIQQQLVSRGLPGLGLGQIANLLQRLKKKHFGESTETGMSFTEHTNRQSHHSFAPNGTAKRRGRPRRDRLNETPEINHPFASPKRSRVRISDPPTTSTAGSLSYSQIKALTQLDLDGRDRLFKSVRERSYAQKLNDLRMLERRSISCNVVDALYASIMFGVEPHEAAARFRASESAVINSLHDTVEFRIQPTAINVNGTLIVFEETDLFDVRQRIIEQTFDCAPNRRLYVHLLDPIAAQWSQSQQRALAGGISTKNFVVLEFLDALQQNFTFSTDFMQKYRSLIADLLVDFVFSDSPKTIENVAFDRNELPSVIVRTLQRTFGGLQNFHEWIKFVEEQPLAELSSIDRPSPSAQSNQINGVGDFQKERLSAADRSAIDGRIHAKNKKAKACNDDNRSEIDESNENGDVEPIGEFAEEILHVFDGDRTLIDSIIRHWQMQPRKCGPYKYHERGSDLLSKMTASQFCFALGIDLQSANEWASKYQYKNDLYDLLKAAFSALVLNNPIAVALAESPKLTISYYTAFLSHMFSKGFSFELKKKEIDERVEQIAEAFGIHLGNNCSVAQ